MSKIVHLHSHTDASISDGLFGPKAWVKALKERGFLAHAVTDHGSMANILPMYSLMKEEGMRLIPGCEFYFVENPTEKVAENRKASHLILLAKHYDGFRNLLRLSQLSYTQGYYYKPKIGLEWLAKHSEGLVCLTACQGGVLASEIWNERKGLRSLFDQKLDQLKALFGDDLYIEYQGHNTKSIDENTRETFNSQAFINGEYYKRIKNCKHVITNDCHYIHPNHAKLQKAIKEMVWSKGLKDTTSSDSATVTQDHFTDSLWLKNHKEVYESFRIHHEYLPKEFVVEGIRNTFEIFEKCKSFEMPKKRYLPRFDLSIDSKDFFVSLVKKKAAEFLNSNLTRAPKKDYIERLKKEMSVILKFNQEDYFLVVWDVVTWATSKGIYVGIGRGSAAGCFVAYLLGIVKVDPLEYGLIFERFLNEHRCESGELPDIDLDFESDRRHEIKEYIIKKYGRDKVCEIGTYSRMKLKTSLIDFGKYLKIATQQELLQITTNLDLEKEDVDDLEAAIESDPKLKNMMDGNPEYKFAVTEIIGQIKSQSVHPAGIVICSDPIAEITPLKTQKNKDQDSERVVTTQSEDKYIVAQGLMKCDVLGLKEYDVIRYVLDNAKTPFKAVDYIQKIQEMEREKPNRKVWKMFQQGKTEGVFQFASDGMKDLLQKMSPNSIVELAAANALYRPGCLDNGWHIQYCNRKHFVEETTYLHPILEQILGETHGVIVFQEQFMEVIHKLGNVSLVDSDTIRSALGKKNKEKLAQFKGEFVRNASPKIGESNAVSLWDQIEKASGYSFNKSHAVVYSVLAYISQYLKVYYPAYFWAAQLDWDTRKNKLEDMLVNKRAAHDMGVEFILPNVNISKVRFSVDGSKVVWSLTSVKGIGEKVAKEIIKHQPFESFEQFYFTVNKSRVKHNNIEALIYAGAFDEIGERRDLLKTLIALKGDKKKSYVALSEEEMMLKFSDSMGFFERKIKNIRSGFSASVITEQELAGVEDKGFVVVGGMISEVRSIKTKKGDTMGFVTLVDLDELIEVTCFPDFWAAYRSSLRVGSVVEIGGKKSTYNSKQNLVEALKIKVL